MADPTDLNAYDAIYYGGDANAGAKTIVVFNLPDLGKTPLNVGTANQAGASALATIYNLQFNGGLATLNDGIVAIDTYGLFNELTANPAAFGFTNVTGTACAGTSLACGPALPGGAADEIILALGCWIASWPPVCLTRASIDSSRLRSTVASRSSAPI